MTKEERAKIEPELDLAIKIREKRPYEALKLLMILNENFPDQPIITGMIGSIYLTLKDWTNALPYLKSTVVLSPRSELASLSLFHTLANLGFDDEAMTEAKRYVRRNGLTPEYEFLFTEMDENEYFN